MNTQEKAKLYDQLLAEYDEKARQVSLIRSRFDLTREDEKQIEQLKKEMSEIERRANSLGSL
jgi:trehalose-6-phosphate synthase